MCLLVNNKPKKNPICSFLKIHHSINSAKGNIFLVVTKRGFKLHREQKIAPFILQKTETILNSKFTGIVSHLFSALWVCMHWHGQQYLPVSLLFPVSLCAKGWLEPENRVQECNLVLWCQHDSENTKEDPDTSVLICAAHVLPRKQSSPMRTAMNKRRVWPSLCQSVHECSAPRITRAKQQIFQAVTPIPCMNANPLLDPPCTEKQALLKTTHLRGKIKRGSTF